MAFFSSCINKIHASVIFDKHFKWSNDWQRILDYVKWFEETRKYLHVHMVFALVNTVSVTVFASLLSKT
jgi:hypothetical protein